MDLTPWKRHLDHLPGLDVLAKRLERASPRPVFMVGSALSLPESPGAPGVPSAAGMIELIGRRVEAEGLSLDEFWEKVNASEGAERYGSAFEYLRWYLGPNLPNEVVRAAVLQARNPGAPTFPREKAYEHDPAGWAVSRGTRALGELLARFRDRYPGPVLTTNFDPLLLVAVRLANGTPRPVVLDSDGRLPSEAEAEEGECQLIHLHGYWHGTDTRHTELELTAPRPQLLAELRRLLDGRPIVVVGYGGWKDAFMTALGDLLEDDHARPDVLWTLQHRGFGKLLDNHAVFLESIGGWLGRGRFQLFAGIDCHALFARLLADEEGRPAPADAAATPVPAPTLDASGPGLASPSPAEVSVTAASDQANPRPELPRTVTPAGASLPSDARATPVAVSEPATAPPGPGPPKRSPQLHPTGDPSDPLAEATRTFDRFALQHADGRVRPTDRTRLFVELGEIQQALDAVTRAVQNGGLDHGRAIRLRTARTDAGHWLAELHRNLTGDDLGAAEAALDRLVKVLGVDPLASRTR